jgi:hypothetical protein
MLPRILRLSALAVLLTGAGAAESEACCWFGGGWSAFRPITWGSAYRRPWTSFYGGYGGGYWGGSSGCCSPCATGCCSPCGTGGCSPCGTGGCSTCGTTSYYGGDACGACAGDSTYSSGYSPGTEPQPDPAGSTGTEEAPPSGPATDDFRGDEYGTERDIRNRSSIPETPPSDRSSIPANPPASRSSIPMNPPENRSSIPMNQPAETSDPFPGQDTSAPAADDAPMWRTPAPQEPAAEEEAPPSPPTGSEVLRIPPLDLEQPIASTYHVQRQRVAARAVYKTPSVARTVVGPNDGWTPVSDSSRIASNR